MKKDYKECQKGPEGSKMIEKANCKVFMWFKMNHYFAKAYIGKQSGPAFFHRFITLEQCENYVVKFLEEQQKIVDYKNTERALVKQARAEFKNPCKVGDLFSYSWGYEQTNVDFFQVIAVKNKSVTLRRIAAKTIESTGPMSSHVVAHKDHFISEEVMEKVIKSYKNSKEYFFSMPHGAGYPTTETETHYCSWYH